MAPAWSCKLIWLTLFAPGQLFIRAQPVLGILAGMQCRMNNSGSPNSLKNQSNVLNIEVI